jgi:ferric-dicitrate binding protein FerR (iron transport regulator)
LRLAERIPELEPYSEPRESSETAMESGERAEQPSPAAGGAMAEPVQQQRRRYSRWASVAIAVLLVGAIAIIVVGWLGGLFRFL